MRKVFFIICIVTVSVVFLVGFVFWFLSGSFFPSPQKPQITHGEFPFKLVYEVDGKKEVVEDVLICEYDGFGANEARGKYRKWKSYLASGNARITLLKNEDIEIFYTPDINQHAAAVYMGDKEIYNSTNEVFPNAWYTSDFANKHVNPYIITADEMWEKYKIKLLSWEIAPPIENQFNE